MKHSSVAAISASRITCFTIWNSIKLTHQGQGRITWASSCHLLQRTGALHLGEKKPIGDNDKWWRIPVSLKLFNKEVKQNKNNTSLICTEETNGREGACERKWGIIIAAGEATLTQHATPTETIQQIRFWFFEKMESRTAVQVNCWRYGYWGRRK